MQPEGERIRNGIIFMVAGAFCVWLSWRSAWLKERAGWMVRASPGSRVAAGLSWVTRLGMKIGSIAIFVMGLLAVIGIV